MMIGDPLKFAIESEITQPLERSSQKALGFFVIDVMGRSYGVREPNATTLGASFNEVGRRIAGRGSHSLPGVMEADAGSVASAFRRVAYGKPEENELFFGMAAERFRDAIYSNHLVWAPDGDEAFDDGSYVLQVESGDQVRLIAFVGTPDFLYDPSSLRDLHLSGDEFYTVLQDWHNSFNDEWKIVRFQAVRLSKALVACRLALPRPWLRSGLCSGRLGACLARGRAGRLR